MHMGMLPQYLTNTLALFTEIEMGVLHPITEIKHFKMGTLYPLAEILYKCSFIGAGIGESDCVLDLTIACCTQ